MFPFRQKLVYQLPWCALIGPRDTTAAQGRTHKPLVGVVQISTRDVFAGKRGRGGGGIQELKRGAKTCQNVGRIGDKITANVSSAKYRRRAKRNESAEPVPSNWTRGACVTLPRIKATHITLPGG